MNKKQVIEITNKTFADPYWRINHLYHIQDKQGRRIIFKLNWAQELLYKDMWYFNIILKARQLGISTFICLLFLDRCLFNSDQNAGIIAHTEDDSKFMFRRVKYAYDGLPEQIKKTITCDNNTANMLTFSNGSTLRVGTSLRSATCQYLHISEFGKICTKYPDKAQEIITGSLETVAEGQYIFIESTAEGREGYFYDMCKHAQANRDMGRKLGKLDYRFHFFPWHKEPAYRTGSCLPMPLETLEYFDYLDQKGIKLDEHQRNWYFAKSVPLGDDVKREYPSTPDEAWEQSNQGTYYAKQITQARYDKRIGNVPYDASLEVHTAWDLGYNDCTSIWFFQIFAKEIRLIEYLEGSGESLEYWIGEVRKKDYVYGKHLAPHDIKVHELSSGISRLNAARKLGVSFIPVPKTHDIVEGIDKARSILNRCWFDERHCVDGIKCLDNYRKEWNDKLGTWRSQPLHNQYSHCADAFRVLATGLHFVDKHNQLTYQHNPSQYQQNRFQSNF